MIPAEPGIVVATPRYYGRDLLPHLLDCDSKQAVAVYVSALYKEGREGGHSDLCRPVTHSLPSTCFTNRPVSSCAS
jgi:hypothetical protein